ncbi:transcriptional regulator [Pseudoduganella sp. UC29_71]|uniref:helix-turn-helix transcriptional regulator n=1 Tax=Pseudoduganella sp. UC29_71 TaxID=3350174 RepID=UPI00366B7411
MMIKPSPAIQAERDAVINALRPVVPMLAAMAGTHLEVVLHDVSRPHHSVVAIANGHISGRVVGSSVLEGPHGDKGFAAATRVISTKGAVHSVVDGYTTVTAGGRTLKSASAIFRDASGVPFATLCLNADVSVFQATHAWLEQMLQPFRQAQAQAAAPAIAAAPQMDALMQEIIGDAVPLAKMSKEEKIQAVREMQRRGLFIVKGGVQRAAAALQVSRFTIYNYMEELRRREGVQ